MPRRSLGKSVIDASLDRLRRLYSDGHTVVVSFSGGKDSGICLELAIMAARDTGRLPVQVLMRDEEIMFPGTFEYAERVAARPEVDFHWIYACQPVINIFDRERPYFWVFDPLLGPGDWVREPPAFAYQIGDLSIESMTTPERFPVAEGKRLYAIIGLRTQESSARKMAIHSSGSWLTKHPNARGCYYARPVYDWRDGDVWKAHADFGWDYNTAYDVMARHGVPRNKVRIAPPTMTPWGVEHLQIAAKAWPRWFGRVSQRLRGLRLAVKYGRRAIQPLRRLSETWEQCFQRTCIDEAPEWISARAERVRELQVAYHRRHSLAGLPEIKRCRQCGPMSSWKAMTTKMYNGDPFCLSIWKCSIHSSIKQIEPDYFRPGSGFWEGKASF